MKETVLVFQKNPQLGKVKTRLAATVGDEKALEIYLQLIRYTKKILDPLVAEKQIWYSERIVEDIWTGASCQKFVQIGEGLGARMASAFRSAFQGDDQKYVVIIGTDCAEIETSLLEEAFDSLQENDFVLGPANDGGYYLLGMRAFYPSLFQDMPWSTNEVGSKTLERISALQKKVHILPVLHDVDTADDWKKIKHLLEE